MEFHLTATGCHLPYVGMYVCVIYLQRVIYWRMWTSVCWHYNSVTLICLIVPLEQFVADVREFVMSSRPRCSTMHQDPILTESWRPLLSSEIAVSSNNSNSNNNSNHDDIYSAVIIAEPLWEFTWFTRWIQKWRLVAADLWTKPWCILLTISVTFNSILIKYLVHAVYFGSRIKPAYWSCLYN